MKKIFLNYFLLFCISIGPVFSQQILPLTSSEIYQKLEQLNTLGTVMYFAAHPDDENTRLISYLVHHDHVRTVYYALTRGDGGQNILGNEQGSALGLIRTHELLQARKIDGAEQMFSPFVDFGYTTSVEETFHFWNKKELIADAVKAIQKLRPDMIICRFPTTGEGGHGHHTVSAIIAKAAWLYISDYNDTAKRKLWLPKRVLFNAFHFGHTNTIKPNQFKLRINQYDPLLGEGLGVLAGKSRSQHKSQGAGTRQVIGTTVEHFQLIEGSPVKLSLYDGIDTGWSRIGHEEIGHSIQNIINEYVFTNPSASIPDLLKVRKEILKIQDAFWRQQKLKEIDHIIISCAGILAEALSPQPQAVPGATINVDLHLIARGDIPVTIQSVNPERKIVEGHVAELVLKSDSLYRFPFKIKLSKDEPITQPYWMEQPPKHFEYQFDHKFLGMPEAPNLLVMPVVIRIGQTDLEIKVPISNKKLDPVRGDVTQKLRIVPPVSIVPTSRLFIYKQGKDKEVTIHLKTYEAVKNVTLYAYHQNELLIKEPLPKLDKGTDTFIAVSIPVNKLSPKETASDIRFSVHFNHNEQSQVGAHLIDYPHIPELQYLTAATMKIVPKNWKVAVQKVGYVEGVGDYVDDVLRLTGLTVEHIPPLELNDIDYLKQYDVIVVGIRALNTQKRLNSGMSALLNYVHEGGTLILQYNKSYRLKTNHFGPYPLSLSRNRVTDEQAKVKFIHPKSELLHFPNTITEKDFNHWVQERGLYFPNKWDSHYQTLFSMHDKGKPALKGAVLYTPYGRGQYIYTSLAFFRQLPAGNVGAIRLFMNFLSAGKRMR